MQLKSSSGTDNWIDYRYYNTDFEVSHDLNLSPSGNINTTVSLNKRGLYCITYSLYSEGNNTISSNGLVRWNYKGTANNGASTYSMSEMIVYSDGTKTANFSGVGYPTFGGALFVIYIGPFTNISNAGVIHLANISDQSTTYTTQNQFVHFILGGQTRYARSFNTENIDARYISTIDPGTYNTFSGACLNRGGKVTCTGGAGNTANYVGNYYISSFTVIE